jgi:membrane protein CcdC involved in cytochrome C biogenesis
MTSNAIDASLGEGDEKEPRAVEMIAKLLIVVRTVLTLLIEMARDPTRLKEMNYLEHSKMIIPLQVIRTLQDGTGEMMKESESTPSHANYE